MAFQPRRSFQRSKIVKDQDDFSNEPYHKGENNDSVDYRNRNEANFQENSYARTPYKQDYSYSENRNQNNSRRPYNEDGYAPRRNAYRDNSFSSGQRNDRNFVREPFYENKRERYESSEQGKRSYEGREQGERRFRDNRNNYNDRSFDRNYRPRPERHDDSYTPNYRNSERFSRENRSFDREQRDFRPRERFSHDDRNFERNSNRNERFERDDFFSPQSEAASRHESNYEKRFSRNENDGMRAREGRQEREHNLRERNFRNPQYNNDFQQRSPRQRGRTSRFYENLSTLFDVDKELLNLLFRRAELLDGVKRDNRISPSLEKKLRVAWENGTAKITKDPRIARDFFNLLQQLEPIPYAYSKPNYYSLAPQFTPVEIDLPGALCSRQMRMLFALAAASGAMASFNTHLSPTLMSSIKAFNQLGGQLWWEGHDRVLSRGGSGIMHHLDKVVPVGNDELSFYLVLAMTLLVPARLKLVGDGPLRFINTQALRSFLPSLNARLTTVIPGQDGIPVRIESAGMMPHSIVLPADLPKDFVLALMLMSCVRNDASQNVEFIVENHPDSACIKAELASVLARVQVPCIFEENEEALKVSITLSKPVFAEDIKVDLDPMYTSCLLAMPAFAGGKAVLHGSLNEKDSYCLDFLRSTGLKISYEGDTLISEHPGKKLVTPDLANAPSYPMALIFTILSALSGESVQLPEVSEKFAQDAQEDIIQGFLAQIGLSVNEEKILVKCEVETNPWFLPNSDWGLALSLLAFMRPNILLVNPEIVTSIYPVFWRVYNTLPCPTTEPAQKEEVEAQEEVTHKRVIASQAFDLEEEEYDLDSDDDFENAYEDAENNEEIDEDFSQVTHPDEE